MITHKYVISLDGSSRRENFFAQDAAKDFEVFPAYRGKEEGYEKYFNINGFLSIHPNYNIKDGEIGCAISHYLLMKKIAEGEGGDQEFFLIAEDDVSFPDNFNNILGNILNVIDLKSDVVNLAPAGGTAGKRELLSLSELNFQMGFFSQKVGISHFGYKYKMGNYVGRLWGTGLYIIRKSAAQRYVDFVQASAGIHWLADEWDYYKNPAHISIKVVRPPIVDFVGESEIGNRKFKSKNKKIKDILAFRTRYRNFKGRIKSTLVELSEFIEYEPKNG